MLVYQVKFPNNKSYIGQTIRSLRERKSEHLGAARSGCNLIFYKAIRKYGKENIEWSIIEDNISHINKLNWSEEFYIAYYDTLIPDGYNLKSGGLNNIPSEQTKQKISEGNKDKKRTEEQCRNISKGKTGIKRPKFSAEWCKNMVRDHPNVRNSNAKSCIIMGVEYENIIKASKDLKKERYYIDRELQNPNNKNYLYIKNEYNLKILEDFNNKKHLSKEEIGAKISKAKKGVPRPDMYGKRYFGASEETIKLGTEKMAKKKTGMKILNYPKIENPPCSEEKAQKISIVRQKTLLKYIAMSKKEFIKWMRIWYIKGTLYTKFNKLGTNIVRAITARNETKEEYIQMFPIKRRKI